MATSPSQVQDSARKHEIVVFKLNEDHGIPAAAEDTNLDTPFQDMDISSEDPDPEENTPVTSVDAMCLEQNAYGFPGKHAHDQTKVSSCGSMSIHSAARNSYKRGSATTAPADVMIFLLQEGLREGGDIESPEPAAATKNDPELSALVEELQGDIESPEPASAMEPNPEQRVVSEESPEISNPSKKTDSDPFNDITMLSFREEGQVFWYRVRGPVTNAMQQENPLKHIPLLNTHLIANWSQRLPGTHINTNPVAGRILLPPPRTVTSKTGVTRDLTPTVDEINTAIGNYVSQLTQRDVENLVEEMDFLLCLIRWHHSDLSPLRQADEAEKKGWQPYEKEKKKKKKRETEDKDKSKEIDNDIDGLSSATTTPQPPTNNATPSPPKSSARKTPKPRPPPRLAPQYYHGMTSRSFTIAWYNLHGDFPGSEQEIWAAKMEIINGGLRALNERATWLLWVKPEVEEKWSVLVPKVPNWGGTAAGWTDW